MVEGQSVLVLGATGRTGTSVVDGLLEKGGFTVIAGVRPSSSSKTEVLDLKSRGIEIRILDSENWSIEQLVEPLKGVDTVIITAFTFNLQLQKPFAEACKRAGVKRFIPCDWGTACTRGVRELYDDKLVIREFIMQLGIGYTFIDVGWWMQVVLPYTDPSKAPAPSIPAKLKYRYGTSNTPFAVTHLRDIGKFVARIIRDPRTLNRYVFCCTEEVTQNEAFALAERVAGRKFETVYVNEEELAAKRKEAGNGLKAFWLEYCTSVLIRGDNTVANAKKEEYGAALDAKELYPDMVRELTSLEEYAKELYAS